MADRRLATRQLWTWAVVIGALALLANVWLMLKKQVKRQLAATTFSRFRGVAEFGTGSCSYRGDDQEVKAASGGSGSTVCPIPNIRSPR